MARRKITQLIDDVDGSEATTSINFAFNGKSYEIDLNDENAEKFRQEIAVWIDAARPMPKSGGTPSRGGAARSGRSDLANIRKWAKDNDHKVSERGRIPASVIEAYDAAH